MMTTQAIAKNKKIKNVFNRNGVIFAGLFGSYAKGIAKKDSDYDLEYSWVWLTKWVLAVRINE